MPDGDHSGNKPLKEFILRHLLDFMTILLVLARALSLTQFESILKMVIMAFSSYNLNLIKAFYGVDVPRRIRVLQVILSILFALILEDISRSIRTGRPNEALYLISILFVLLTPILCIDEFRNTSNGKFKCNLAEFSTSVVRKSRGWTNEESFETWLDQVRRTRLMLPLTFLLNSVILVMIPSAAFSFIYLISTSNEIAFYSFIAFFLYYRFCSKEELKLEEILKPLLTSNELLTMHPLLAILISLFILSEVQMRDLLPTVMYIMFYSLYLILRNDFKPVSFLTSLLLTSSLHISRQFSALFSIAGIILLVLEKRSYKYKPLLYINVLQLINLLLNLSYIALGLSFLLISILFISFGTLFELSMKRTYVFFAPAFIPPLMILWLINARLFFCIFSPIVVILNLIFIYLLLKGVPQRSLRRFRHKPAS